MIEEVQQAPALKLATTGGETIDLSAPGGKLVLYFYPKDDTSGCTREAQDFTALAAEFEKAGVKVVGVSRDPMTKHEKFIGKYRLSVALAALAKAGLVAPDIDPALRLLVRMLVMIRLVAPAGEPPPEATRPLVAAACGQKDWDSLLEACADARQRIGALWRDVSDEE